MQTIDQKMKGLREELTLWNMLLQPHMERLRQMDAADYMTYTLGQGTLEEDVSAEFALESLIAAYGRLRDVALAGRLFWPQRAEEFGSDQLLSLDRAENIIGMVREKSQTNDSYLLPMNLINKRIDGFDKLSFDDQALDPEELFTLAHRWRRTLAKASVLETPAFTAAYRMRGGNHWVSRMQVMVDRLPYQSQSALKNALRRYLASEFIFPWLSEQYSPYALHYTGLFKLAGLEERSMMEFNERIWDEMFGPVEINSNTKGIVMGIFERIAEALIQIGDYDELVNQIVSGGGSWGGDSLLGSPGRVNIIPADEHDAPCHEILVAFARGRRSPRFGLSAVMRQVREHLIRCGDSACRHGMPTRIAIIITDLWDKEIFSESLGDLRAHRDSFPGKVIIGALVNKDRITPQAII